MNPELEMALRLVGFATALLGTCAAVPAASWRLIGWVRSTARTMADRVLRRRRTQTVSLAPVDVALTAEAVTVRMTYPTGGSIEERLGHLERHVQQLDDQQANIAANLGQEVADRIRENRKLGERLTSEVGRLEQALAAQQRTAEEIDARALPAILVGAGLSTFSDALSIFALVGTFAVGLGVAGFFWAWYLIDSHRSSTPESG
jgi:hypothetical protein